MASTRKTRELNEMVTPSSSSMTSSGPQTTAPPRQVAKRSKKFTKPPQLTPVELNPVSVQPSKQVAKRSKPFTNPPPQQVSSTSSSQRQVAKRSKPFLKDLIRPVEQSLPTRIFVSVTPFTSIIGFYDPHNPAGNTEALRSIEKFVFKLESEEEKFSSLTFFLPLLYEFAEHLVVFCNDEDKAVQLQGLLVQQGVQCGLVHKHHPRRNNELEKLVIATDELANTCLDRACVINYDLPMDVGRFVKRAAFATRINMLGKPNEMDQIPFVLNYVMNREERAMIELLEQTFSITFDDVAGGKQQ